MTTLTTVKTIVRTVIDGSNGSLKLHTLPEDIIKTIIETGYADGIRIADDGEITVTRGGGNDFSLLVSHICKRLRRIVISTPAVWTFIYGGERKEELSALLDRSKGLGLTLRLGLRVGYRIYGTNRFMDDICKHTSRWKHLSVDFAIESHVHNRLANLKGRTFPLLKTMKYPRPERFLRKWWNMAPHGWELPSLTSFSGNTFLAEDTPNLTHLKLSSSEIMEEEDRLSVADFKRFWARLPTFSLLRSLKIDFCKFTGDQASSSVDTVYLPNLNSLHYQYAETGVAFWSLFMAIEAPRLEDLSIALFCPPSVSISAEESCQHIAHFPTIRSLCVFGGASVVFEPASVTRSLVQLRQLTLKHLRLSPPESSLDTLSQLRSLQINYCRGVNEDYINALQPILSAGQHFQKLELVLAGEEEVSREYLERMKAANPGRVEYYF